MGLEQLGYALDLMLISVVGLIALVIIAEVYNEREHNDGQ